MKVVAINGSHRAEKSTSKLVRKVLDGLAERGWETELVELSQVNVAYCTGCSRCLTKHVCPLRDQEGDDCARISQAIAQADAVILASPNYFENVSARMKCLMDRLRLEHMAGDTLAGKPCGIVATTGNNNSGVDLCVNAMQRFAVSQKWLVLPQHVVGTWDAGDDEERNRIRYRAGADTDPRTSQQVSALVEALDRIAHGLVR